MEIPFSLDTVYFKRMLIFIPEYFEMKILQFLLKGYSSQREVHSINLHMYTILVVPSNCAQRSLINN